MKHYNNKHPLTKPIRKKQQLGSWLGKIIVPSILRENQIIILHISDTPSIMYPAINKLLDQLQPDYVFHTGDFVDNLKLEKNEKLLTRHRQMLKRFMFILKKPYIRRIYLTPGNHDKLSLTRSYADKQVKVSKVAEKQMEGVRFRACHHYETAIRQQADYYLYGHNKENPSERSAQAMFLNGIMHMHVISLPSGQITRLLYPMGTDEARFRMGRLGL